MNLVSIPQEPTAARQFFQTEVEIVQLGTYVKETLQFPEIEQIPVDCSRSSETEEVNI